MKYYLIFEASQPGTKRTRPTYIVENENVAKDFCKEFSGFYYEEREDGIYCFLTNSSAEIPMDVNPLSKGLYDDIKCPYCGAQHFIEGGSWSTAMYCPTIVKDGKVISEDHNIYTTSYHCLGCGKEFKTVNGKVEKDD